MKTVRGSLAIVFCVFKLIGYYMPRAMKSGILRQLDSRVQMIQTDQLSALFCKLFN